MSIMSIRLIERMGEIDSNEFRAWILAQWLLVFSDSSVHNP